jgi:ribonuclease HI
MAKYIDKVKLFTDGACRGNPGPGAIGFIIIDENNNELESFAECIGETTNNRAEYLAVIKGLDCAAKHTRGTVYCFLDSELVINQMSGKWRLKDDELRRLFFDVKGKNQAFKEVIFTHVRRTNQQIKKVDRLLKQALEGL